ncbi:AAA family ATPase [Pseudomonas aeruginosa]
MQLSASIPMAAFGSESTAAAPCFPAGHELMEFVRKPASYYKFRQDIRMPVMNWLYAPNGDALALVGPTGTGKSSLIREICALLNWPYAQENAHSRMEVADLVGMLQLTCDPATGDQQTKFVYGSLARAMKFGMVFCLDEADVLDPSVMSGFNAILEGEPLVISQNGGEVIVPHPNFRFVVTCNTRGQGDETGLMAGTQTQNLATWDRYRMIEVPYMDEDDEVELMQHVLVGAPEPVLRTMVQVANNVRAQFVGNPDATGKSGNLTVTFSTRTLLRWGRVGVTYQKNNVGGCPLGKALRESLTNRAVPVQRLAIHGIAKDLFGSAWDNDEVLAVTDAQTA